MEFFEGGVGFADESALWVHHPRVLFSTFAIIMNRLFKNKRKQSPETSLQNTFTETPDNIVAGPVTSTNIGFGGGRELGSEGRRS